MGKKKYFYNIESNSDKLIEKQIICGYTCMDHDRLMIIKNERELNIGDKIVFKKVGSYTMTFSGMFIKYLPEVYLSEDDSLTLLRSYKNVDDYIYLESNEEKL